MDPQSNPDFTSRMEAKIQAALARASRDFRSDVVTVPSQAMMEAILNASVLDDIYDVDPSVLALENRIIELTGKEAALWTVSGTQGNQLCLRTHLTQPPHSVLLDHRAHIHCSETGALPVMSQASVTMVHPKNGVHLTVEDVKACIIPEGNIHAAPTRVVALENTLSGTILPLADAQAISQFVRAFPVPEGQKRVAMHLDGARIMDGVIAEGVDLQEYAACFDSVSICLSKGLGAPMGSVIVGSKQFIQKARLLRKMFGGSTRQPGMMAAAALTALDYSLNYLSRVHIMVKTMADRLQRLGYKFALPVQTNMIVLDLNMANIPGAAFVDYCAAKNILVFPKGRIVFHHQISDEAVEDLFKALEKLFADGQRGIVLSQREAQGGY